MRRNPREIICQYRYNTPELEEEPAFSLKVFVLGHYNRPENSGKSRKSYRKPLSKFPANPFQKFQQPSFRSYSKPLSEGPANLFKSYSKPLSEITATSFISYRKLLLGVTANLFQKLQQTSFGSYHNFFWQCLSFSNNGFVI